MKNKIIIPKIFTRDHPLVLWQIWGRFYKHIFEDEVKIFPKNVFIFHDGFVDSYRHADLNFKINTVLLSKISEKPYYIYRLLLNYEKKFKKIKFFIIKSKLTTEQFIDFLSVILDYWLALFISLNVPQDNRFTSKDREVALRFRKKYEEFEYKIFNHIDKTLKALYPELGELARFVSLEEIQAGSKLNINLLKKRRVGKIIVIDDKIITNNEFLSLQNKFRFFLEEVYSPSNMREFKGQTACGGRARGRVVLLLKNSDISKVERGGDIIVSFMTTPNFISAMEKAVAFITDEGGITSHAAIIARELKKPCIIGTKIATKVLHDGDLVEVDANKGVVKILKRKKRDCFVA